MSSGPNASSVRAIELSPARQKHFPFVGTGSSTTTPKMSAFNVKKGLAALAAKYQFEFQPRSEGPSVQFKVLGDDKRLMHELGEAIREFGRQNGLTITFDIKAQEPGKKDSLMEMTINASVVGGFQGAKKWASCVRIVDLALERGFMVNAVVVDRGARVQVTGAVPESVVADFERSVFEALVGGPTPKKTH